MKYTKGTGKDILERKSEIKACIKIIIFSSVIAMVSLFILILCLTDIPQEIRIRNGSRYLYDNGIEVEASIKRYYEIRSTSNFSRGQFMLVYEYIDETGKSFTNEERDGVYCRSDDEWESRENEIKELMAKG